MSKIPALMGGRALEHGIALEKGKGFRVKGQTTLVQFASSADNLLAMKFESIDMENAAHALITTGTAGAGQTKITSNILIVDANGGAQDLTLPAEAVCPGVFLLILNSGGETIVVKDDGTATIITLDTVQHGILFCDGAAWRGFMGAIT